MLFGTTPLPSPAATPSPQGEGLGSERFPALKKTTLPSEKNHRAVRKTTMPSEKWRLHFPRESYIIPRRFPAPPKAPAPESDPSGFSEVWYRAWFGTKRPWVQVPQPGPCRVFITDLSYEHSTFFFHGLPSFGAAFLLWVVISS